MIQDTCTLLCSSKMCRSRDAGWPTRWNVDLAHASVSTLVLELSLWQKQISKSVLRCSGFDPSVGVNQSVHCSLGDSFTVGEVNLVASYTSYTTSPNNPNIMYARSVPPAVHTRAICAVRLQSGLFRHDFAFVVFYLSLLFMWHQDTISPSVHCKHLDQLHVLEKKIVREASKIQILQLDFKHFKRNQWSSLHNVLWYFEGLRSLRNPRQELEALTLIGGVGTFCARSISGCSSQLTFPVPRSFTQRFAWESRPWMDSEVTCQHTQLQTRRPLFPRATSFMIK